MSPFDDTQRAGDFTADTRLLILVPMAVVVGVMGAGVAFVLVWLIGTITNLAYYHRLSSAMVSPAANHLGVFAVLIPVVGGLIVGLLARYGSEKIRGHGIPEAMEAILIGRSRMEARVAVLKPIASAISIGTGGPFGAEGPIIMTGGAFGSLFAQAFHLTAAERKTLLVAGAAAGMSAIFSTPLAAILLAVELLLFEWKPRSLVPVAAAAIVAAVLRVPLLGAGPIFPVTPHGAQGWHALIDFLGVGIMAGLGSAALTLIVYAAEDAFKKLTFHYMWWPVIGGLVVGLGGLIEPRALGVGYDTIRDLLDGQLHTGMMTLLSVKAVTWSVALGSGTSGGVLAPLLIMGGALGAAEAHWVHALDPGLWATIGMAAMMGGTMRSPLTSVAFVLELTHDVALLPALLVACVAAHTVTVLLMKRSILTEKVARRGYHVMREYSVSPFARFRVEDVMVPDVTPASGDAIVMEIAFDPAVVTYPDEVLERALHTLARSRLSCLPVVLRDEPTRRVGVLGWDSIASAYQTGLDDEYLRESSSIMQQLRLIRHRVPATESTE
jgi:chloride channel protein, CIC family